MPVRNDSFVPYDAELLEDLAKWGTDPHSRQIVLNSRRLSIIREDGRKSSTCVLPRAKYEELKALRVCYRSLAYRKWLAEVWDGD